MGNRSTHGNAGLTRRQVLKAAAGIGAGVGFIGNWRWARAQAKKPIVIGLTCDATGTFADSGQAERRRMILADNDTVVDYWDNCPLVVNNNQANSDGDPFGDACDLCPNFPGTDNADPDKDGMGNSCDTDDDNDGLLDGADNCPVNYNPEQHDVDGDGKGWACDYDDAAALLRQLKILTLQDNRYSPIASPCRVAGCAGRVISIHSTASRSAWSPRRVFTPAS